MHFSTPAYCGGILPTAISFAAVLPAAADEAGSRSILQWVLSTRPEPVAAEQQLQAAWQMADPLGQRGGGGAAAALHIVAWLAWAAALCGADQLATTLARRASASVVRLHLCLQTHSELCITACARAYSSLQCFQAGLPLQ